MNFVVKVDVCIQRLSANAKDEVRLNRQELLITLPRRRVWLFLKQIRAMGRSYELQMDGPEDVIARGKDRNHLCALYPQLLTLCKRHNFSYQALSLESCITLLEPRTFYPGTLTWAW